MLSDRPILIADDDEDDIFFAKRAFQKTGVPGPILTCANGREVVALLSRLLQGPAAQLPRVVFLDIKMPELSGLETLKWIRGEEGLREIPVIMLSGSKETRDTEQAQALGADGYLVKYPSNEALAQAAGMVRQGVGV